jgi:hypothetical protein
MAKKKKRKFRPSGTPPQNQTPRLDAWAWPEKDGIHYLVPGSPPTPKMLEEMTKQYQENIRNSPLWGMMVKQFGREKAEELLKACRAELR